MNQQAEALHTPCWVSKTAICMITQSCPQFHLGVDTIKLPCKSQFFTRSEGAKASPLADS